MLPSISTPDPKVRTPSARPSVPHTGLHAATGMWALNLKAGGSCLTPRHPQPAARSPLAAGIGSLAVGPMRWMRQPVRWPRLAVSASGRKGNNGREDGDEPKNKAASSGRSSWPSS